uniref:Uncharacterized protein n=1 Tax=Cliftonaea pectinata TaxID=2007206 RepID=A0A1Z1MPR0_9FLOR|nr:hypothetical protein [Cliftonaea pectinata]ARW68077.1 hypothetical protein [Cliftonaea pectinata]
MNFYINTFNEFYIICNIHIDKIKYINKKFTKLIPIQWQIVLINEGSFTQIKSYFTNKISHIKFINKKLNLSKRYIRCIWLLDTIYTKTIFARSIWLIMHHITLKVNREIQPIGISFINKEIDIYKNIHEIYYVYSKNLENNHKLNTIFWGRKYTLNYRKKSYTIIQEFFSSNLLIS